MRGLGRAAGPALLGALLVVVCLLAPAAPSRAAQTSMSALSIEQKGSVYEAEGSVVMERDGESLRASRVRYDEATGMAEARGGVLYEAPGIRIEAERAVMDLDAKTGEIYDATIYIKEGDYRIEGKEILKDGEDHYVVRGASLTTCPGPVPDWCISGRDVDIVLGDRVRVKGATLSVRDFPVLYVPYLQAPILTERKTGLLFPTFGYRKSKGIYWQQPFFWNIAENRDATLFMDAYSLRGVGKGLEYRYIEKEGVEGNAYFYHLRDTALNEDFYQVKARHEHRAGGPVEGYLDLDLVGKREFLRLYEPYLEGSSRRFLQSRAEVYAPFGNSRLYILGRYDMDLLEGTGQSTVLQRLPEAGYFQAPARVGPLLLEGRGSAANFEREDGEAGLRYDLDLAVTHAAGRGLVLTQRAGVRETYYDLRGGGSVTDHALSYRAALSARLERSFGSFRHALEPSVSYNLLTVGGETPPLMDALELPTETSSVELALMNRFFDGRGEFLTLRVAEALDAKGGDRPFLPLLFEVALRRPAYLASSVSYDVNHGFVERADTHLRLDAGRVSMYARHNYRKSEDITLLALGGSFQATRALTLTGGVQYDPEEGGLREMVSGLGYQSQCWAVRLDYIKRPDDYSFFVLITLKGLGSFGT
ncbi:MAG: LptA/OstA family protein [Thermodesulfovibrionales bacterium]